MALHGIQPTLQGPRGEAIRQARLAKNLTQEQLGEKVSVQKSQISRLERGKYMKVHLRNLTLKIACMYRAQYMNVLISCMYAMDLLRA